MKVLTGRLYFDKVDQARVKIDRDERKYIDVVFILNDEEGPDGKAGVIQQNTAQGDKRIYLSNLFTSKKKSVKELRRTDVRQLKDDYSSGSGSCDKVCKLESRLFKSKKDI